MGAALTRCPETGKAIYRSEAAAVRAVREIEDAGRAGQAPLHAYPCDKGTHWHVGHRAQRKDQRPARRELPPPATPPRRRPVKARRSTPRRRDAVDADRETWTHINDALLRRSNGRCERCGKDLLGGGVPVSRHHRQRSRDGGDRLANLMLLCGTGTTGCHGWITEHPAEAAAPAYGWIVRTELDPAAVPVRLADGYLYTLDDAGNRRIVP